MMLFLQVLIFISTFLVTSSYHLKQHNAIKSFVIINKLYNSKSNLSVKKQLKQYYMSSIDLNDNNNDDNDKIISKPITNNNNINNKQTNGLDPKLPFFKKLIVCFELLYIFISQRITIMFLQIRIALSNLSFQIQLGLVKLINIIKKIFGIKISTTEQNPIIRKTNNKTNVLKFLFYQLKSTLSKPQNIIKLIIFFCSMIYIPKYLNFQKSLITEITFSNFMSILNSSPERIKYIKVTPSMFLYILDGTRAITRTGKLYIIYIL